MHGQRLRRLHQRQGEAEFGNSSKGELNLIKPGADYGWPTCEGDRSVAGTYGRLRTVTTVPGADQLWLSTTNCDDNGGAADGSDQVFRVTIG
ncbi:PQQ-dependent sugar dehydrogenase [Streptomyces sp. NRRL WC-3725]|uniref:PQQ-dependent sugar dehydrogenase n=1 Tax=Streptomyces sp. NRRL WC-3725 TaxID=1463933 RepID=UPI0004C85196